MTTYNVANGERICNLNISGETEIIFSMSSTAFSILNNGKSEVTASVNKGYNNNDDGVYKIPSEEFRKIAHKKQGVNKIYVNGSGEICIYIGEDCPFKKKGKGGDSGGEDVELIRLIPKMSEGEIFNNEGLCSFDKDLFYEYPKGAYIAFDRDTNTSLKCRSTSEKGAWVSFEFFYPKIVKTILVTIATEGCDTITYPFAVDIKINDEWVQIYSVDAVYGEGWGHNVYSYYDISINQKNVQGIRWRTWREAQGYHDIKIVSIQAIGKKDDGEIQPVIPVMTSNTEPKGLCEAGNNFTLNPAYYVFDGNDETGCMYDAEYSHDGYVIYNFDSPCDIISIETKLGVIGSSEYNFKISVKINNEWIDVEYEEGIRGEADFNTRRYTFQKVINLSNVEAIRWSSTSTKTHGNNIELYEIKAYK